MLLYARVRLHDPDGISHASLQRGIRPSDIVDAVSTGKVMRSSKGPNQNVLFQTKVVSLILQKCDILLPPVCLCDILLFVQKGLRIITDGQCKVPRAAAALPSHLNSVSGGCDRLQASGKTASFRPACRDRQTQRLFQRQVFELQARLVDAAQGDVVMNLGVEYCVPVEY